MNPGILVEITWSDEHLVELQVRASNGRFAATTELYEDRQVAARLAAAIDGFPASPRDRREWEIGTFDSTCAGGGMRACFRCADASGHAVVDVDVRAIPPREGDPSETARFSIPIDVASVDLFVHALQRLSVIPGSRAHLETRGR